MFNITVVGDSQLIAKMDAIPEKIATSLYNKVWTLALKLEAHIKQDKLQGQVLAHRTGALQRSINSDVQQTGTSVIGKVFSSGDVKYAAIHEYGGIIPAHDIEAKNASCLAFTKEDSPMMFFKKVHIPDVTMPERSFMRSALKDMQQEIIDGMTEAVKAPFL